MKTGPYGARKPGERSRMRMSGPVTVDDVLASLVGHVGRVESSTGAQLEIAQATAAATRGCDEPQPGEMSVHATGVDVWRAKDRAEMLIGLELGVSACISDLAKHEGRWWKSRLYPVLSQFANKTQRSPGEAVLTVLRAYHERSSECWTESEAPREREPDRRRQLRGLAQVSRLARDVDAVQIFDAFLGGKQSTEKTEAISLYSDALLLLGEWVEMWRGRRV